MNREGLVYEAIKFDIIDCKGLLGLLTVVTLWILALKVANTSRRCEGINLTTSSKVISNPNRLLEDIIQGFR